MGYVHLLWMSVDSRFESFDFVTLFGNNGCLFRVGRAAPKFGGRTGRAFRTDCTVGRGSGEI